MGKPQKKKTKEDMWYFTYNFINMHEFLDREYVMSEDCSDQERQRILYEIGYVIMKIDQYWEERFDDRIIRKEMKKVTTPQAMTLSKGLQAAIKNSMGGYIGKLKGGNNSAEARQKNDDITNSDE